MDSSSNHQQLMDTLTAHIALYHSSIPSSSSSSPSPSNPSRNLILRWFSSLSVPHRQSFLTVVDPDFLQILLQMQRHLLRHGHGFFILLPDLPSPSRPTLPSLCFRRSRGLLSRSAASNASLLAISSSIRIFASKEGEPTCSPSPSPFLDSLDSITVSDDLVADVDRFVSIMDEVSDGGFLRGDDAGLDSSWCELPWLKAKGYYSVQAFVANRIELALRLAWLNCNGGKKRGTKSKDKEKAAGVIAGVAANVFWRKKGCLDWWSGLDPGTRRDILRTVLGRAAKSLANEIVEGANQAANDEKCLFDLGAVPQLRYGSTSSRQRNMRALSGIDADVSLGIIPASISGKPSSLANACNRLLVLQEISTIMLACQRDEYEKEKLFFSMLGSVHTVSDCLFRRLRGLLMVVSNDCIKLELLGDNILEAPPKKSKEKSGGGCHKGKNKGRNLNRSNSGHKSSRPFQNPQKVHGSGLAGSGGAGSRPGCLVENGKPLLVGPCVQEKDLLKETSSLNIEMERVKGPVDCKTQITRKKSRKKLNYIKNSNIKGPIATGNSEANITETTLSSFTIQSEPSKFNGIVDPSIAHHLSNVVSDHSKSPPNPSICNAINEPNIEDVIDTCENIQKHSVNGAAVSNCHSGIEHFQISNRLENGDSVKCDLLNPGKDDEIQLKEERPGRGPVNDSISSGDTLDCAFDSETPPVLILVKDNNIVHRNSLYLNDSVSQPVESSELNETVLKDEIAQPLKKKSEEYHAHVNSSLLGGISYEWPNLTSVYIPSANSWHIPAATDRLHLDVGHNWRSHLHQSYVSTRHQARNASMEGGCSRIMPSQILPMSLDWPPMVRGGSRLVPSVSCNYDSGFIPRLHSSFCSGFTANGMQLNGSKDEDDRKYNGDFLDFSDIKIPPDLIDDSESHWMAEDESEVHAYSGRDYNQYFGGGVMYWNTADPSGTGFSRPPSLSSEDSSWAWHEADLNRAIDDMVGLPGLPASYSTNGLTSPPAGPFCSPFDQLGPGHQHLGYVIPGNDVNGKVVHPSSIGTDVVAEESVSGSLTNSPGGVVETMSGDSLSYPILRPIIVSNISRKGSGTEFKISHDHKSPCVPPTRRETPRIKRPPSPVVLCVPRAPRPPPPSPVGEPRKQRGFPTVRSGSSSPRHWGVRSWYHDGTSSEEARFCVDGAEVVWPSWGNKGLPATPMIKPLPGSLLQDRLIAISQLPLDQEHPDVALPLQPPDLLNCAARNMSLTAMHNLLHDEIDCFCKQVAAGNLIKKPYINWAVKRVARSLQVLWPRSTNASESMFDVTFEWDERMGIPGALIVKNLHCRQFFLKSLTLEDVPGKGQVHFDCNSWVYPAKYYKYNRVFFSNESYLPHNTPAPLRKYREEELVNLRGNGQGKLKEWDRVYDYAFYNDLGLPDKGPEYARPVLGGSKEYPYPRRGRTGRKPTKKDPKSESRLPLVSLDIYVPKDERFGVVKMSDFLAYALKSIFQVSFTELKAIFDKTPNEFDTFEDVMKMYEGGIPLPDGSVLRKIRDMIPFEMIRELIRTDNERLFKFPTPQVIQTDRSAWRTDKEFAREMLAGVNPVIISLLQEFPPKSKLDPNIYGNQNSSITEDHILKNLHGLTVDEALKKNKLFILDHHDTLMPYVKRINTTSTKMYATRTILLLSEDGTLTPLAIELSLPHPDGEQHGAVSKVFTPAHEGVEGSIWQLAKAYVAVNDSGYHQLISHWLNTHAVIEPFVIATNRQLSVLHPIHKLLNPHYRDTMNINALARQILINAGGILEYTVFPGKYAMEMSSVLYKNWVLTEQGLPADLKKRGIAVEDSNYPHNLRLLIEDYPYAVDGLEIWSAIETWVKEYCYIYYSSDASVKDDTELQSWWAEVRDVGHGDKKDEPWWPNMSTLSDLTNTCTIIIWVASALHAAVNFGQYPYAGYLPNRPTISRRFMPQPGTSDYNELRSNPDSVYLRTITAQLQTLLGVSLIEILSRHPADEVYLGQRATPEWTSDVAAKKAFEQFGKKLLEIEKRIELMNNDERWKNRVGPVRIPYMLLFPNTSDISHEGGLTGKGIPNSISI